MKFNPCTHALLYATCTVYTDGDINDDDDDDDDDDEKIKKRKSKSKKYRKQLRKCSNSESTSRRNSHQPRKSAEDEVEDEDESEHDTESDVSDLNETDEPIATVKTFDTLLKYIMRQKGQYREGLLDVYANPQTHVLVVEAFSQMKQLQPAEQAFLWPALLKRWTKYARM